MKKLWFLPLFVLSMISIFFLQKIEYKNSVSKDSSAAMENIKSRRVWEFERLKNIETNSIPDDIHRLEKEFASTLPVADVREKALNWVARGPYNVGGRTRGAAVDITDGNTILAGGVSGGIWKTTDGGQTWSKKTTPDQLHNVSTLSQDKRPGKTNIWYYGTGEVRGNSAGGNYANYYGDGIFKSIDNGESWQPLQATYSGTPTSFDRFDYIWRVCTDPNVDTADVVYAAIWKGIYKSNDGGESWYALFPYNPSNSSTYTDILATASGVYATLGDDGILRGIYRSSDGEQANFVNILPDTLKTQFSDLSTNRFLRIIIAVNPQNENQVYFFANTFKYGQKSNVFFGEVDYHCLWKYTYINSDGTGAGGVWEDLTPNLPNWYEASFDNLYSQQSYDMAIAIKPDDENVIFIGGTNIYRSTDGFTTQNNVMQIGGYKKGAVDTSWDVWANHHPDQHVLMFLPDNPDVLISASDGGLHKFSDCTSNTVSWERLNNGYLTTQVYAITMDETATNDILIAGFQDNGNFFTNSDDPQSIWVMPLNGDGSYGYIADDGQTYYLSIQLGKLFKMQIDNNGNRQAIRRIDPDGVNSDNYLWMNPFMVDPADNNILYWPSYKSLYRNDSLHSIDLDSNITSRITQGWTNIVTCNSNITAIDVTCAAPLHRVYMASNGRIYRVDNANTSNPVTNFYTFPSGVSGYVSSIASDPENGDKVLVTISNYGEYSVIYSEDGCQTFSKVAGNLEENPDGSGAGPSCRWANILHLDNGETLYMIATSVGMFATDQLVLTSDETQWLNVGNNIIGNCVVETIKSRETDNLVVVGTHGTGIYSSKVNTAQDMLGTRAKSNLKKNSLVVYPNPARDFISVSSTCTNGNAKMDIYSISGTKVLSKTIALSSYISPTTLDISALTNGTYILRYEDESGTQSKTFIKQ